MESFVKQLAHCLLDPLPGKSAHARMMPFPERLNEAVAEDHTKASVMILLREINNKIQFPLILRNAGSVNDPHRGQIGLPGGRFETSDHNLAFTALRETREEIGIPSELIQIIGSLTPLYIPVSKNLVHPFIGFLTQESEYQLQESEIQDIFHCSLESITNPDNIQYRKINTSYAKDLNVQGFQIENRWIWGATAMMLAELKELIYKIKPE